MALSRNDPFSMPVIQCLGSFLGMTASSLSVSILMARSSSTTRPQAGCPAGAAAAGTAPASRIANRASDKRARTALLVDVGAAEHAAV